MNPYLQALLMRVAGGDTLSKNQSIWPGTPGGQYLGAFTDPGIYGAGMPGGDQVMLPRTSSNPDERQLGLARNVLQGLQNGQDVNLTGSGFELSPQQLRGGGTSPTALDMLQQYLRPAGAFGAMNNLGAFGGWQ